MMHPFTAIKPLKIFYCIYDYKWNKLGPFVFSEIGITDIITVCDISLVKTNYFGKSMKLIRSSVQGFLFTKYRTSSSSKPIKSQSYDISACFRFQNSRKHVAKKQEIFLLLIPLLYNTEQLFHVANHQR